MLWRCWLDGRKVIRPVKKTEWWGLAWLSVWNEVETCIWPSWWHCHSLSLASVKSRLVLPFWYRLTRVVPKKWPLNGCMYVCFNLQSHVGVNVSFCSTLSYYTHSLLILTSQKLLTIFGPHLWVLHTHTCFMALCPGLPGKAGTRKVKPVWILLKQWVAVASAGPYVRLHLTPDR